MTKPAKFPSTLTIALVLFGLSGSVIAAITPHLFAGSESPGFLMFLVMGVTTILLTTLLFHIVDRLRMGFTETTIVLAVIYNALIATIKFGLAPSLIYQSTDIQFVSLPLIAVALSVGTLALYVIAFSFLYLKFKRQFEKKARPKVTPQLKAIASRKPSRKPVDSIELVVVTIATGAIILLVLFALFTPFAFLQFLEYLLWIFLSSTRIISLTGFVILLALGLAIILAYTTFGKVEKEALALKDATLLANFFWLGLSLILIYHAMWVVFLLTLFSIWPLKLYIPK